MVQDMAISKNISNSILSLFNLIGNVIKYKQLNLLKTLVNKYDVKAKSLNDPTSKVSQWPQSLTLDYLSLTVGAGPLS